MGAGIISRVRRHPGTPRRPAIFGTTAGAGPRDGALRAGPHAKRERRRIRAWHPNSSICGCTASTRSRTASCASTMRSSAAAADGMPALALTDLANVFGMVKFYQAARGTGVKPIVGCDVLDHQRAGPRQAVPAAAAVPEPRRLPAPVRAAVARLSHQPAPRPRRDRQGAGSASSGTEGLIALSGAPHGDVGHALAGRQRGAGRAAGAALGRSCSRPLLPRAAARRPRRRRGATCSARCASRRGLRLPVVATHPVQFLDAARTSRRTRRACASPGLRAGRPAPAARFHARAVLQDPGGDGASCSPTCRRRWRTASRSRALQPRARARQEPAAAVSDARTAWPRRLSAQPGARRASSAAGRAVSRCGAARAQAPRYRERLEFEIETIIADGLRRLLPDRRRLHQLGEAQRRAGRPGARLGRGLAGRLLARASPTSIRCATTCCSSASSIPSACRCPTSTSTSARTGATA